eukprot:3526118-Pleurochrysis_carterae.AAC.1
MRSGDSSDGGDKDGGARGEKASSSDEAEGELVLALMGVVSAGGRWHARDAMARRARVGAANADSAGGSIRVLDDVRHNREDSGGGGSECSVSRLGYHGSGALYGGCVGVKDYGVAPHVNLCELWHVIYGHSYVL